MNFIKKKTLKLLSAMAALSALLVSSPCNAATPETAADLVVYGKIYTANASDRYAEAFAVKDGKYVYVGDKKDAKAFIKDGVTKVIDRSGKGLVMPGATEGHGHYMTAAAMTYKEFIHYTSTIDETIAFMKGYMAAHPDEKMYLSFGWSNVTLASIKHDIDMRSKLDAICPDKIVVMIDNLNFPGSFSEHKQFLS